MTASEFGFKEMGWWLSMADLLFAVVTLAFFALMVAFAFACDRL